MNALTLRINKGGAKKGKTCFSFSEIDVTKFLTEKPVADPLCQQFLNSKSTDEQLAVLKKILDKLKDEPDEVTINFLVAVFLETEPKHPVKCFMIRHVTKSPSLQQAFSMGLSKQIQSMLCITHTSYKLYVEVVSKLASCMDNFPAGSAALKMQDTLLANYLDICLRCCIDTLKNLSQPLSPTEKNEIFNLVHTVLRLLLQFYSHQTYCDTAMMHRVRDCIQVLLFDEDVPMDTKSVCGILYLTLFRLECGSDAWLDILSSDPRNDNVKLLLSNPASQLSLLSAIATLISGDKIQSQRIDGEPALLLLSNKILDIAERSSSDSVLMLGVTRTLLQISKSLAKVTDSSLGRSLVAGLHTFVWAHLDYYMDSVRHLTAQILSNIVKYCSKLEREGDPEALNYLFNAIACESQVRKSYYVTLSCITAEIGAAAVLARMPCLIRDVIDALSTQAVQASATTTLETLLCSQAKEARRPGEGLAQRWVEAVLRRVAAGALDSAVLNILENLLVRAASLDSGVIEYILPRIKSTTVNLQCALMLASVVRKSGIQDLKTRDDENCGKVNNDVWRGIIGYDVLEDAAINASDETRLLALSLIVDSPKSTEVFKKEELHYVLFFVKYNFKVQSPNFRQVFLSLMKKLLKRLKDSYNVLKRDQSPFCSEYNNFLLMLRRECFDSLLPGANYGRRMVALQLIVWIENISLDDKRIYQEYYVNTLLRHLDDSHENNKAYALEILLKIPAEEFKKEKTVSVDLEDVLKLASSVKPTDCATAAYMLDFIRQKMPEKILEGSNNARKPAEQVLYELLRKLHTKLCIEQEICEKSIVNAAVNAPMYGILHCMVHLMTKVDEEAISSDDQWKALVDDIIQTCMKVTAAVESVVNNSSPEGHLPMDMGGVTDHGNIGGIRLKDGRQVTAQMVLLCAWRTVKEVSLLLGEMSSRLVVAEEGGERGTLNAQQLLMMGEHFTKLLAETKHRGAFEQAYVGFTKLLARLWRCRSAKLHAVPGSWLRCLLAAIGAPGGSLCATRRSAGLPFMIQALVTTELQVQGNPKCFHECMTTLFHLARTPPNPAEQTETAIETRTHCINILRALFRNSSLDESVAGYVGDGLVLALEGFEGRTWMERNSSTLLLSALTVRVFGVTRGRDGDALCLRNRMTGRIFFLRYPRLYDYMLNKLKAVNSNEDSQILQPSLYPILLLLARLYPSALEGTVSNLKLVSFVPLVVRCAHSAALRTRRLAARAMVPLISPERYIQHLKQMLDLISDRSIKRNYCHGILLQVVKLIDAKPESLSIDQETKVQLSRSIDDTLWILQQATGIKPCWPLLDEYVGMINVLLMRFPSLIQDESLKAITNILHTILFTTSNSKINSGRDISRAHSLYLLLIISEKYPKWDSKKVIYSGLEHSSYEVILSCLNYLTIKRDFLPENKFEEHLSQVADPGNLNSLHEDSKCSEILCKIMKNSKYPECTQKALKALSLSNNAAKLIVETELNNQEINDEITLNTLIDCVQNNLEILTHIYLQCLEKYIGCKLTDDDVKESVMLKVIRVLFECCTYDNSESTRKAVVDFLEANIEKIWLMVKKSWGSNEISEEEQFELKASFYSILMVNLEDDEEEIRRKAATVVWKIQVLRQQDPNEKNDLPREMFSTSRASEMLRDIIESEEYYDRSNYEHYSAILVALALLDFKSEVCMNDDSNDECRVFDQNERYNIFLEETIWTKACAEKLPRHNNYKFIPDLINSSTYKGTLEKLCRNNLVLFKNMLNGDISVKNNVVNPKIQFLINSLKYCCS